MMRKSKINITILTLLLFSVNVFSQSNILNQKKYWWYRYRLVNDFLIKGDCKGCSEPMNQRAFGTTTSTVGYWGDQTISLANYISVLATEFKLLSDNSLPTDTTVEELYYAIRAFNRLDHTAESAFSPPGGPFHVTTDSDLNGFFMRDDVDNGLLYLHYPKLTHGITTSSKVLSVISDYSSATSVDKEMSHDQIWHLFTSFALIRKLMYPGITYKNKKLNDVNDNDDIYEEALAITNRMMNYLKDGYWILKKPISGLNVDRGWYVQELSHGATQAACFIKDLVTLNAASSSVAPLPIRACTDYDDAISLLDAGPWNLIGKVSLAYTYSEDDYKPLILATIGNSWWSSVFIPPYINQSEPEVQAQAVIRDWQHIPLLQQVLHNSSNVVSPSFYDNLINSAPCNGPKCYHPYPTTSPEWEWTSSNRLLKSDARGGASPTFYGEYNGLDYMLYYNLYLIVTGTPITFNNWMDKEITFPFPTGSLGDIGTFATPSVIDGFHSIRASNTINDNADITYRAGIEVALLPGFEVHVGANFHAYVDPFECASDGEYRNASNNSNDSSFAPTDNLVAYNGPTTYVYYPKTNENATSNSIVQSDPKIAQNISTDITSSIAITPNPNNGNFLVSISGNPQTIKSKIVVYDIMGNIVKQLEMLESINVDISTQAKGIYFVRIENEQGIKMEKIVFQ